MPVPEVEGRQSRQSTRLFLQSSELGLPPSPAGECVLPSFGSGGDTHSLRERGWGGPNSDGGTDTMVLLSTYLYMHFVFTGMGEGHYTQTI
jgi:hypothetical protein